MTNFERHIDSCFSASQADVLKNLNYRLTGIEHKFSSVTQIGVGTYDIKPTSPPEVKPVASLYQWQDSIGNWHDGVSLWG